MRVQFPPRPQRMAPLPLDEQTVEQQRLLDSTGAPGLPATNIFSTLVRNERIFRRWLPFCAALLSGAIPARERELVVLRVGWLCRSEYEWAQHEVLGRRAGLEQEEIDRIPAGPTAEGWSSLDRTLLSAVDEVHETNTICDETWACLSEHFGEEELIELLMLIGQYHLVSFALNAMGVQVEPDGTEARTR